MSEESWRSVPGYEGHYEVSDQGRVRSLKYFPNVHVMSPYGNRGGYRMIDLSIGGERETHLVHRVVLQAFVGPCPAGMECCHRNGQRADNRLANLRWGTRPSNARDQIAHGTHHLAKRERCPRDHEYSGDNLYVSGGKRYCRACQVEYRKTYVRPELPGSRSTVNVEAQLELVDLRAQGVPYSELAERYGISQPTACTIFKAYAKLNPELDKLARKNGHGNLGAKPKLSDEQRAELIELRLQGKPYQQLAERFGISKSLACMIYKEHERKS